MPLSDEAKRQARLFVISWNTNNPLDSYWRRTFNIPFGSKAHKEIDFIDQQIWYEEDKLLNELRDNPEAEIDDKGRVIIPSENDYGMSEEQILEEFESMDINELNAKYGKRKSNDTD